MRRSTTQKHKKQLHGRSLVRALCHRAMRRSYLCVSMIAAFVRSNTSTINQSSSVDRSIGPKCTARRHCDDVRCVLVVDDQRATRRLRQRRARNHNTHTSYSRRFRRFAMTIRKTQIATIEPKKRTRVTLSNTTLPSNGARSITRTTRPAMFVSEISKRSIIVP